MSGPVQAGPKLSLKQAFPSIFRFPLSALLFASSSLFRFDAWPRPQQGSGKYLRTLLLYGVQPACLPAQLCAVRVCACALIMFNNIREGISIGGYQLGM